MLSEFCPLLFLPNHCRKRARAFDIRTDVWPVLYGVAGVLWVYRIMLDLWQQCAGLGHVLVHICRLHHLRYVLLHRSVCVQASCRDRRRLGDGGGEGWEDCGRRGGGEIRSADWRGYERRPRVEWKSQRGLWYCLSWWSLHKTVKNIKLVLLRAETWHRNRVSTLYC